MSSRRTCPQCGTRLPAGTSPWLCPKCLLGQAAEAAVAEAPSVTEVPATPSVSSGPLGGALPCRLGAYELLERIGQGGMGVVYKARQLSLDRYVAVKVLSVSVWADRETVHRFRTEAVTAGSLQHPNIVAVHEVGLAEGQHYLVMDYVAGPTLAKVISDFGFRISDFKRSARWVRTIAEAVHFAHERGILHRDLKPSNVLLDENDEPRVTDFGLAKRLADSQLSTLNSSLSPPPSQLTLSGQVLGSPAFIPPEQAAGQRNRIGRRSDVYALGAILYQLLTGRPPFVGEALADTLRRVLTEDPLRPRLLNPAAPADLETICLKCLEKEPERRYPTAQALAEELGRWLDQKPILARPLGPLGKGWRWCRRRPLVAGLIAGLGLAIAGGFLGIFSQLERAKAAELTARRHAYAADMNLVQQALEDNDLGRARELLNRHRPVGKSEIRNPKSEIDLRGWEWRYLWARSRGEERSIFCQLSNSVSAAVLSPDRKWLAIRSGDLQLALWEVATRRLVSELDGGNASQSPAFSPHDNLLACGGIDTNGRPVVRLWDLRMPAEIAQLEHTHKVLSLAFSPEGKEIAALAYDGNFRVWNLESKQIATELPATRDGASRGRYSATTNAAETEPLWSQGSDDYGRVAYSSDGRWLVIGESKPLIRLVDRATGKQSIIRLEPPRDGVAALAISPGGKRLAAGCGYTDFRVHVWDLGAGTNGTLAGHRSWVKGLAFSPDGQTLASVSADKTLRLWDVARGTGQVLQGHVDEVWSVAWSADGQTLVTGSRDGSVRLWDPTARPRPAYLVLPPICFYGPAFLPDSKTLLAVTRGDGSAVRLEARWDAPAVREVEKLSFLGTNHVSLVLSRDGCWLALGDSTGNIRVWDFRAQRQVTNLWVAGGSIVALVFSPQGRVLNAGTALSHNRIIPSFWDVTTWREIPLQDFFRSRTVGMSFSPDDRTAALGFTDGTAAWYDLTTGKQQHLFDLHCATSVKPEFSPDRRRFLTIGVNGLITLWDVATLRPRPVPRSHRSRLYGAAFSPDGQRFMVSGSGPEGVIRLWEVEACLEVATLAGEPERHYSNIGFSPDGNTIFAASPWGPAVVWCAPSWQEIEAAEEVQGSAVQGSRFSVEP